MTFDVPTMNPVPRYVRLWSILTLVVTLLLLFVLGGFVTSFKVGMADVVWPTEPWYLVDKDWSKLEVGFLLEHTHRAAGWIVGAMVSVMAILAWATEPNKLLRAVGLGAIVALLISYGEFHRAMMKVWELRQAGTPLEQLPWPITSGYLTAAAAGACCLLGCLNLVLGRFGKYARSLAMFTLLGVMIQGLLGGFRVLLDQLFGTQLAAFHGVFAQVVLGLMMATVVLMTPRRPGDSLPASQRSSLLPLAIVMVFLIYLQLVWAAWTRHLAEPLAQRLHLLTAFLLTAAIVWFSVQALLGPGRKSLAFLVYHMLGILAVQLALGVEAYLAKFAAVGPQYNKLPLDRVPTVLDSTIRTGHAVIGAALLACLVVLALRVGRHPVQPEVEAKSEEFSEVRAAPETVGVA